VLSNLNYYLLFIFSQYIFGGGGLNANLAKCVTMVWLNNVRMCPTEVCGSSI